MPTYKITGPDGKTYKVTGDGTADDALKQVQQQLSGGDVLQQLKQLPPEPSLTAREPTTGDRAFDVTKSVLGDSTANRLRDNVTGMGAAFRGAVDGATFGLADMFRAGKKTIDGEGDFSNNLEGARAETKFIADQNPVGFGAGNIGGAMIPGVGALKAGVTATRLVRPTMGGARGALARTGANAADGAAFGAATALGHGEDATLPTLAGAVAGPAGQVLASAGRGLVRPIAARIAPETYAKLSMGKALDRSGKTPQDIYRDLMNAGADGQSEFMLADALGNPGQRMLSTVARTPNEMRGPVTDALLSRQAGQGDRLTQALVEGFNAPDTAAQRTAVMKSARGDEARGLYDAAARSATGVDITPAIQTIDDMIRPGIQQVAGVPSTLADDSVTAQLQRYRARMGNDKETLTDFRSVLQLKSEVGDAVDAALKGGQNNRARQLTQLRDALDKQLEGASVDYRAANDTYRQRSGAIDAIDQGAASASGRVRFDDSIPQFQRLPEDAQDAFRAGYVDPAIAKIQTAPFGNNKARSLMSMKTAAELPEFAAPGRGDQMMRRIGRENHMFETNAAAMGGSKTADNLADEAEMMAFDPSVIGSLLTGNIRGAAVNATRQGVSALSGQPPSVREQLGRMLLTTAPQQADVIMRQAIAQQGKSQGVDDAIIRMLIGGTTAVANQTQP